jgi:hypothetical protein
LAVSIIPEVTFFCDKKDKDIIGKYSIETKIRITTILRHHLEQMADDIIKHGNTYLYRPVDSDPED